MKKECMRLGFFYENEQWVEHLIYVALPSDFGLANKPPVEVIELLSKRITSSEAS